jgi:hypothetical protein
MIQDIVVTTYETTDSYKQRAIDNFKFLWSIKDKCTVDEAVRLQALNDPNNDWKYSAFKWLDDKRCAYDAQYDRLRTLQGAKAILSSRIKRIEQEQEIAKLKRIEKTGVMEPSQSTADCAIRYLKDKGIL